MPLGNRRAIRLADVVSLIEVFRAVVTDATRVGWRIVALFGMPEDFGQLRVVAVLADDERGQLAVLDAGG